MKKGRLWKFVSPWILNSDIEFNVKPVIRSPQLISSAEITKQKILKINQIIELIDLFFLEL